MSKDPEIELEHVYLFNIPREIRELKKILSKYRGTKLELGLDDVLDCVFYLVASNDGYIDLQEVYDYIDSFTGFEIDDPNDEHALDAADIHGIAQVAEDIMNSEGAFLNDEVEQVEWREKVYLYFTRSSQVGNTGYVEVKVQYQRRQAIKQD